MYYLIEDSTIQFFKTLDAARKYASRLDQYRKRPVVLIYGSDHKEVGAMFNLSYFPQWYPLNVVGVWRVAKSGNCRYVKPDGSLASYADDHMRRALQPKKYLNAATGKIVTRRY